MAYGILDSHPVRHPTSTYNMAFRPTYVLLKCLQDCGKWKRVGCTPAQNHGGLSPTALSHAWSLQLDTTRTRTNIFLKSETETLQTWQGQDCSHAGTRWKLPEPQHCGHKKKPLKPVTTAMPLGSCARACYAGFKRSVALKCAGFPQEVWT